MFVNGLHGVFRTGRGKAAVLSNERTQDEAIYFYKTNQELSHEITFSFRSLKRTSVFLNIHLSPGSIAPMRLV